MLVGLLLSWPEAGVPLLNAVVVVEAGFELVDAARDVDVARAAEQGVATLWIAAFAFEGMLLPSWMQPKPLSM